MTYELGYEGDESRYSDCEDLVHETQFEKNTTLNGKIKEKYKEFINWYIPFMMHIYEHTGYHFSLVTEVYDHSKEISLIWTGVI